MCLLLVLVIGLNLIIFFYEDLIALWKREHKKYLLKKIQYCNNCFFYKEEDYGRVVGRCIKHLFFVHGLCKPDKEIKPHCYNWTKDEAEAKIKEEEVYLINKSW